MKCQQFQYNRELYACTLQQLDNQLFSALSTFTQTNQELIFLTFLNDEVIASNYLLNSNYYVQLMFLNNILLAAGDEFTIYKCLNQNIKCVSQLSDQITLCFDFNLFDETKVISGSLSSLFTIWDIIKRKHIQQIILPDNSEILDISLKLEPNTGTLLTCSNSIFQFDYRIKYLYPFKIREQAIYNIIKWNKFNDYEMMAINQKEGIIDIYDIRNTALTTNQLIMSDQIIDCEWISSKNQLISTCFDGTINKFNELTITHKMNIGYELHNMCLNDNYLGIVSDNKFQLIQYND